METYPNLTVSVLTSMLSTAIAPVTLVGGISFLLSIMATRYSRCIDRIRNLLKEITQQQLTSGPRRTQHVEQIQILYARIRHLRWVMTLASSSIFGIVLTICGSFSNLLFHFPSPTLIAVFFMIALLLLVAAVTGFIRDILISLRAVKIEIASGLDSVQPN